MWSALAICFLAIAAALPHVDRVAQVEEIRNTQQVFFGGQQFTGGLPQKLPGRQD